MSPKIRITGLQEAQLADLVRIDALCSDQYYAIGFDAAEVPARTEADLAALGRANRIRVLESEGVVAGFVAWHDESPGIALVADVQVHPEHQRTGVGSRLIEALREDARGFGFEQMVVRCWEKATWALAFYRRQRFMPIDATAPARVTTWKEEQLATGRPLTRPGEVALWSPIRPEPGTGLLPDDPDSPTLLTGLPLE